DNCVPFMLVSAGQPWRDCGIKETYNKGGNMPTRRCQTFEAVMTDEWKTRANRLGLTGQPFLPLRSPEILRTRAFWGHSTSSSQCAANPTLAPKCLRTTPLFSNPRRTVCFGPILAH
ncbi:hypothetical protein NEUTE2DRAFT_48731, partial [Neurospora tetrasperma FGSC 2509]